MPRIPSSDEIGDAVEQFLASHDSSPLDRVQKLKQEPHYSDELRRMGNGLRHGQTFAQEDTVGDTPPSEPSPEPDPDLDTDTTEETEGE